MRGLSLIELLVVVAIMAIVAGGVALGLQGDVEGRVSDELVMAELVAVKQALLAFHADTGHLPGQGPFSLHDPLDPTLPGVVQLGADPDAQAWFESPANLGQLFENPLAPPRLYAAHLADPADLAHPLRTYRFDSRRGWNGPYLAREGTFALPAGLDLTGPTVAGVPGVADPYGQPGHPYLLLTGTGVPANPAALDQAKLVSLGADGALGTSDDLEVHLR